jgi:hypothetical protein
MSARRRKLARQLMDGAIAVVGERAPWLSERAYRAVIAPLHWVDPLGGARAAEARLDGIRDRVAGMAASGRVRPAQQRRIQRDLARTREDLERVAPHLPAVQARGLARRLAGYTEALATIGDRPAGPGAPAGVRGAAVFTGSAAAWSGVLLLVASTPVAVEAGLATGVVSVLGDSALRHRRARQARTSAVADALVTIDRTTLGSSGVDLRRLDGERRALLRRARNSGRLDERGLAVLSRIDVHLDDLLVRLVEGDLDADVSHLVQASITRYLPDTLVPFLTLNDPQAVVQGRPVVVEVADQLAAIESGLAEAVRRPSHVQPETLLLLQGEFLRSKFGESTP